MRTHVTVLAWLQIAFGLLELLLAAALFGAFTLFGVFGGLASGEFSLPFLGPAVGAVVATIIMITAVPNLLAGWGLMNYRNWARILAIVLAVLNGLKFPWGTAFAVYTIWVLVQAETKAMFRANGAI